MNLQEDIHRQIFPVGTAPAPSVTREDIRSHQQNGPIAVVLDGRLTLSWTSVVLLCCDYLLGFWSAGMLGYLFLSVVTKSIGGYR